MTVTSPPFPPCPHCGSTDAVEIAYGYRNFEMADAAERGEIVLGGCIVGPESPAYECRGCNAALPWVLPKESDSRSLRPLASSLSPPQGALHHDCPG